MSNELSEIKRALIFNVIGLIWIASFTGGLFYIMKKPTEAEMQRREVSECPDARHYACRTGPARTQLP